MSKSLMVLSCGLLAACIGPSMKPGNWPGAGSYVCVVNSTDTPVWLSVRDGVGHELPKGRLGPQGRVQFLWPFIDRNSGVFIATTREGRVTMSETFRPWEGPKAWAWDVSNPTPLSASHSFCPEPAGDVADGR